MNAFINYLSNIVELPEGTKYAINEITYFRNVPKGTLLLSTGQVCTEFHFIASGLARVFYYKDTKDVTVYKLVKKTRFTETQPGGRCHRFDPQTAGSTEIQQKLNLGETGHRHRQPPFFRFLKS